MTFDGAKTDGIWNIEYKVMSTVYIQFLQIFENDIIVNIDFDGQF